MEITDILESHPHTASRRPSNNTAEPAPLRLTLKVNPLTAAVARTVGAACCRSVRSFVFVASTGRSGTHTLQSLLATVPGCVATFEPDPIMHGRVMREFNSGDDRLMRSLFALRKLPTIFRVAAFQDWYVETNHLFIKSFFQPAVEAFRGRMQVIHLIRDMHDVAASLYFRGSMNLRGGGYRFHLDPAGSRNEIQIAELLAPTGPFKDNYFACLWESYEIAARVRRFRQCFPEIPVHLVRSEQLDDASTVRELIRTLGMPLDETALQSRLRARLGASPSRPPRPTDLTDEQIAEFCALCEKRLSRIAPEVPVLDVVGATAGT